MLMEVKNNIRYLINALKVSIKSAMAYKVSFIIQSVFMIINNGFFLIFWKVIFNNTGESGDMSFDNILYLWSISTMAYGIAYFFFGGIKKINEYILNGTMDSFILQPKNLLLNVISSKCTFSAFGDFLYGFVICIIVTHFDIPKILLILVLAIIGSGFFISTEIIFRSLAVWIGDTNSIATRYTETLLTTFSTYPENIFSVGIKVLLYTVIPAAYVVYLPIKLSVNFNIWTFLSILVMVIIYVTIAILVFNKAMKSYESGNNMSMKD